MNQEVFTPNDTLYRRIVNALKSNYYLLFIIKLLNPGRRIEILHIDKNLKHPDSKKDLVLDVGCGDGFWTRHFSQYVSKVVGIEPYKVDLKKAIKYADLKTEFIEGTAEKMSFESGVFRKVVSVCVFEHLYNDTQAFSEFHRVLTVGGLLLATVDSLNSPFVSPQHREWHMHACYCKQLYDVQSITKKLTDSGFKSVEAYYIMGSRISVYWEILIERMGVFSFFLLPFFYPAILLTERGPKKSGYKIFVKAVK